MKGLIVNNGTVWNTEDLRKYMALCLRARGASGPRLVTFAYRRQGARLLGCADVPRGGSYLVKVGKRLVETTEGYRIKINLPRPEKNCIEVFDVRNEQARFEMKPEELRKVFITIEHEVDHTMGLRHRDMEADEGRDCRWAEGWQAPVGIRLAALRKPNASELRGKKIAEHEKAIKRLETRAKRIETAIATRRRRIHALEAAGMRERNQAARRET